MGIFDSDWQKLHKKLSRQYELIALRRYESGEFSGAVDAYSDITEIVRENLTTFGDKNAAEFVKTEYKLFKDFNVRETIADALRQKNPNIPESGISEIFEAIRRHFHNTDREHEYFLFFVISKLIELKNLSISRGEYLIEISRGNIPKPSGLARFFQMWRQIARYQAAKDRKEG